MHYLLLIGRDMMLYELLRSNAPVAKGTIISTNHKNILGGEALGKICEVVVNCVLKRDGVLPHTFTGVEKMDGAYRLSILWPYKRVINYSCHYFLFSHM
jgi:hypothetical protein